MLEDAKQENLPAEQQEWVSSMEEKEPEPPHVKEGEEQLQDGDIPNIQMKHVTVKSEGDDAEREPAQSSRLRCKEDGHRRRGEARSRSDRVTRSLRPPAELPEPQTGDAGDSVNPTDALSGVNCMKKERGASEKPFVCPFCSKPFNQRVQLSRHLSVHTGDKPFHCTVCSKMFATRDRLRSHTKIHTGEKPFSCSVCGKRFFHRAHLVKHSHIHTGVKPFPCLFCGKRFYSNGDLIKHTRTHTGEKPFTCSICNTSFSDTSTLGKHKIRHTGEKPFSCSVCDKRFPFKFQVKKHKCAVANSGGN
ncbi:oocyte zinc finger protein XlCOF19-like isoform X1 [Entelurus aequoreus]|uniref:oocyte zinc finger protein XlCOF19-like isoform X1 n=1 Tax=Entelurus aequoreus TaxID=161455 RepID=UPI002B1E802A|nr:oocyte zinc finger protein XlCOF19-like isoform X1 [Entelurus aequoreus]